MIVIINLLIMWAFCYFGWQGIKYKWRQCRRRRKQRKLLRQQQRAQRKAPASMQIIDGGVLYPEPRNITPPFLRIGFRNR